MDTFKKQSYEEFTVSADFSANLLSGETIVSQTVDAIDNESVDASDTVTDQASVDNDGASKVTVLVRGGTEADSPYKLTVRCVTSIGHKWELDMKMAIREL